MKDAVIRARCDVDLKARVAALAARMGLEEADIVRLAVRDYLNRHSTQSSDGRASVTVTPDPSSDHALNDAAAKRIVDTALRGQLAAVRRKQRKS